MKNTRLLLGTTMNCIGISEYRTGWRKPQQLFSGSGCHFGNCEKAVRAGLYRRFRNIIYLFNGPNKPFQNRLEAAQRFWNDASVKKCNLFRNLWTIWGISSPPEHYKRLIRQEILSRRSNILLIRLGWDFSQAFVVCTEDSRCLFPEKELS